MTVCCKEKKKTRKQRMLVHSIRKDISQSVQNPVHDNKNLLVCLLWEIVHKVWIFQNQDQNSIILIFTVSHWPWIRVFKCWCIIFIHCGYLCISLFTISCDRLFCSTFRPPSQKEPLFFWDSLIWNFANVLMHILCFSCFRNTCEIISRSFSRKNPMSIMVSQRVLVRDESTGWFVSSCTRRYITEFSAKPRIVLWRSTEGSLLYPKRSTVAL